MKTFELVTIVAMVGLVANAVGLSAPINGYEVVNITWTIQPRVTGATNPLNFTGTVQEVWRHINTTWPSFISPPKTGLASRQGTLGPPTIPYIPHNLTDGKLKCGYWPKAEKIWIEEGIGYLYTVPGKPRMPSGPRSCGRVSCSGQSAIWWCNDNNHTFRLNSFDDIADAASDINLICNDPLPPRYQRWTSGQMFFSDKWNVIVMEDSDHC